jgi:hypothetical protein
MSTVNALKKEVSLLHRALIIPAEDKSVIMSIDGKDYTIKNLHEGIEKLVSLGRGV